MENKRDDEKLSFPLPISEEYGLAQQLIEDNLMLLYEQKKLPLPKAFFFKSPFALGEAMNYINGQNPKAEFAETYERFFSELKNQGADTTLIDRSVFFGKTKNLDRGQVTSENLNETNLLLKNIDEAALLEVQTRLGLKSFNFYQWFSGHVSRGEGFTDLGINGLMYFYPLADMVLWCPKPSVIKVNLRNRLHSEDGPAVAWNDGFNLYYWKGTKVRRRLIEHPESYTKEDILAEQSPEVRYCIQEKLGDKKYLSLLGLSG